MGDYTSVDLSNAIQYANNRLKLRQINFLYQQTPQIISWFNIKIEQADPIYDYYYPDSFKDRAIKVSVSLTKDACENIGCNTSKINGACAFNEEAQLYRIGDSSTFTTVCQPACYNLKQLATYDENGDPKVQSLRTEWVEKDQLCALVPNTASFMECPLYRSKEHYQKRLNDLALGFNYGPQEDNGISLTGQTYSFNEYYCSVYNKTWDPTNKTCNTTWYDRLLSSIVGENIINIIKAGVSLIENGTVLPTPSFPDAPPPVDPKYVLNNWRRNINTEFILPSKDIKMSDIYEMFQTREMIINDPEGEFNTLNDNYKRKVRYHANKLIKMPYLQRRERDKGLNVAPSVTNQSEKSREKRDIDIKKLEAKMQKILTQIGDKLVVILQSMTTLEFWEDVAINVAFDIITASLRTALMSISNNIIPLLLRTVVSSTELLLSRVLISALTATLINTTINVVVKLISQTIIALCRILAQAVSIIGIILIVISLFDIALAFWDPLGFNNMFNTQILRETNLSGELSMRRQLLLAKPTMNYDIAINLMLEREDSLRLNVECFTDMYEYLASLTVNSEGTRIEKGTNIDVNVIDVEALSTNILARRNVYTPEQFNEFENTHQQRMSYFKSSKIYLGILFGLASTCVILEVYFAAIILFIIIIALIFTVYLNGVVNVGRYIEKSKINLNLKN